jgi:Na+/melibiose symporter-like transporter
MSNNEIHLKSIGLSRRTIITLTVILISIGVILMLLMCIYPLPGQSTIPITGSLFYLLTTLAILSYFFLQWKRVKSIEAELVKAETYKKIELVLKESMTDKILKWIITITAIFIALLSTGTIYICIYGLYDRRVQAQPSILFFIGGLILIGILVYEIYKKWSSS